MVGWLDNYSVGVEFVWVSARTGKAFLFEVLGYGEDFVHRW